MDKQLEMIARSYDNAIDSGRKKKSKGVLRDPTRRINPCHPNIAMQKGFRSTKTILKNMP